MVVANVQLQSPILHFAVSKAFVGMDLALKPMLKPTTKDGSTVRYVGTVRYASIFAKKYGTPFLQWCGYGTLVRYALFVKVRVRYVGTLFELKIPHFSHIAPAFSMRRQKTAEANAKCVN